MKSGSASFRGESRPSLLSGDIPIVFVVDDDMSVRESLESLIRFAGWHPQTFASAQEFLSHARGFVPSCLVLDVTLPDLNGLDLQKRIVTERIGLPIIFITGHGDVPTSVRAMKAGAVAAASSKFLAQRYLFHFRKRDSRLSHLIRWWRSPNNTSQQITIDAAVRGEE